MLHVRQLFKGSLQINKPIDSTNLWCISNMFSTVSYQPYGLHARVWEGSVTRKLWKTLYSILKWVNGRSKILFEYCSCNTDNKRARQSGSQNAMTFKAWRNKKNRQFKPVVWNASSTIPSSWSEAARWNTEKIFFQPDLMLAAWEWTICATQRTTISRIVGDLQQKTPILQATHTEFTDSHQPKSVSKTVDRLLIQLIPKHSTFY